MNRNSNNNRSKSIMLRVKPEEKELITRRAEENNMSITEYVKKSCLNDTGITTIREAPKVLTSVSELSNYINSMEDSEIKTHMKNNLLCIWRILGSQFGELEEK